jgi:hypothetical protein
VEEGCGTRNDNARYGLTYHDANRLRDREDLAPDPSAQPAGYAGEATYLIVALLAFPLLSISDGGCAELHMQQGAPACRQPTFHVQGTRIHGWNDLLTDSVQPTSRRLRTGGTSAANSMEREIAVSLYFSTM